MDHPAQLLGGGLEAGTVLLEHIGGVIPLDAQGRSPGRQLVMPGLDRPGSRLPGPRGLFDGSQALGDVQQETAEMAALERAQVIAQLPVLVCLAGGALKCAQARFDLGEEIGEPGGVGLRLGQVPLGLGRLEAQTGQIGGMLEQAAAFLGALAEGGIDQTLPDHRVALAERGRQPVDVLEANLAAIDQVGCLAGAEGAASDRDFREVDWQPGGRVVEGERDLGHPGWGLARATGEDDILRLLAAQRAVTGLAECPAHGVGNVRLTAPVRTDDSGNAPLELEDRLCGEALEPDQLEASQAGQHGFWVRWRRGGRARLGGCHRLCRILECAGSARHMEHEPKGPESVHVSGQIDRSAMVPQPGGRGRIVASLRPNLGVSVRLAGRMRV